LNREDCGRWSRLLKKRELLAYYRLCREESEWNIGEAVDQLCKELLFTRRVSFSIIRRLKRIGLLVQIDHVRFRCVPFTNYIEELYKNYICKKRRRLKTA